jgi:uncharacterized protein YjiS (DUF1127 family)
MLFAAIPVDLRNFPEALLAGFRAVYRVRKQRQELSELSDQLLDDIGITREQAEMESRIPLWLDIRVVMLKRHREGRLQA